MRTLRDEQIKILRVKIGTFRLELSAQLKKQYFRKSCLDVVRRSKRLMQEIPAIDGGKEIAAGSAAKLAAGIPSTRALRLQYEARNTVDRSIRGVVMFPNDSSIDLSWSRSRASTCFFSRLILFRNPLLLASETVNFQACSNVKPARLVRSHHGMLYTHLCYSLLYLHC